MELTIYCYVQPSYWSIADANSATAKIQTQMHNKVIYTHNLPPKRRKSTIKTSLSAWKQLLFYVTLRSCGKVNKQCKTSLATSTQTLDLLESYDVRSRRLTWEYQAKHLLKDLILDTSWRMPLFFSFRLKACETCAKRLYWHQT